MNNLNQIFDRRTAQIRRNQIQRFTEKRDKRGRLRQSGRDIPYSLEQLREWVKARLGNSKIGCARCAYECGAVLDAGNFCLDHQTPTTRGGSLALDNLAMCCDTCNRIKGKLTAREYLALRQGLETFSEAGRDDVYSRLKTGAGFQRLRYFKPREEKQKNGVFQGTETQADAHSR